MITDSSTIADAVESKSKIKVLYITSQDVADRMAEFGLCQFVKIALAFGAHHLEFSGNTVTAPVHKCHIHHNQSIFLKIPSPSPNLKLLMEAEVKIIRGMSIHVLGIQFCSSWQKTMH